MRFLASLLACVAVFAGRACTYDAKLAPACEDMEILALWREPKHEEVENPHNPHPPAWPAVAAIVAGKVNKREYNDPNILVLASLPPGYDAGRLTASQLMRQARVVVPCDFRKGIGGRWLYFKSTDTSVFVIAMPSGGRLDLVSCFWHDMYYDVDCQKHFFHLIYSGESHGVPIALGDADKDGEMELFVGTPETNASGVYGPKIYEIIELSHWEGNKLKEMPYEEAMTSFALESIIALESNEDDEK